MYTNKDNQKHERRLQFFNKIIYESLPSTYNAMDYLTLGAWWRLVRQALTYVPTEGRVLEVGFGPGRLQVELAQHADLCLGVDLAMGMCCYTQKRLQHAQLPSHLTRASIFSLPYPSNSFDSVVSTFAFSGFPNGELALREMSRVTAVSGQIVLVDIGLPTDGNRLGIFLARTWERMGDFLYDLPQMMQDEGLTVTEFKEFGPGNHIRAVVGQKQAIV